MPNPPKPTAIDISQIYYRRVSVSVSASGATEPFDGINVQKYESNPREETGAWVDVGKFTGTSASFDCSAYSVKARARTFSGGVAGTSYSDWLESEDIYLENPPEAPSGVTVGDGSGSLLAGQVTVSWVPEHPDNSRQSRATVSYRMAGDADWQSLVVEGDATSCFIEINRSGTLEVRVATMGIAENGWGASSETVTASVESSSGGAFSVPADGSVVTALPLVAEWSVDAETGISSQVITLSGDGGVLHTANLDGKARSYTFDETTYLLGNGKGYKLSLTARTGNGAVIELTASFTTSWAGPAQAGADLTVYPENACIGISVSPGEPGDGQADTVSVAISRENPDGTVSVLGSVDATGTVNRVYDMLPPLNVEFDYILTAFSRAGSTAVSRVAAFLDVQEAAFNFGDGFDLVKARLDASWGQDTSRAVELYHFADGGQAGGLPMAYGGADVDTTRSQGFKLLELDDLRRLQGLAAANSVCWYRDPYGGRYLVSVSWSFSSEVPYGLIDVSADMTDTVFEEIPLRDAVPGGWFG